MSAEYKEYGWEAGEAHMQARIWQGVLRLVAQTRTKGLRDQRTKGAVKGEGLRVRGEEAGGRGGKVEMFEGGKGPEGAVKSEELRVASEEVRGRKSETRGRGSEAGGDLLTQLRGMRVLDVGCGNGFMCGQFLKLGCEVTGIDLSEQGVARARESFPAGRFEVMGVEELAAASRGVCPWAISPSLGSVFPKTSGSVDKASGSWAGAFDIVISTEVVEHLYRPREWARGCFAALRPGGRFVCTTPYHGYLKNLAIALAGKWDRHASPLWDGGHIKLWSKRTLFALLQEAGFRDLEFRGIGRVPGLWMTMVVAAVRPEVAGDK